MDSSTRVGLRFCPLEYIKTLSKELNRALDNHNFESFSRKQYTIISVTNICTVELFGNSMHNNISDYSSDTPLESKKMKVIRDFINKECKVTVMVYTDGSVYGGVTGCRAYLAILYPPYSNVEVSYKT